MDTEFETRSQMIGAVYNRDESLLQTLLADTDKERSFPVFLKRLVDADESTLEDADWALKICSKCLDKDTMAFSVNFVLDYLYKGSEEKRELIELLNNYSDDAAYNPTRNLSTIFENLLTERSNGEVPALPNAENIRILIERGADPDVAQQMAEQPVLEKIARAQTHLERLRSYKKELSPRPQRRQALGPEPW